MEGTLTITFCYPSNIVINSGQYNLVSFALGCFFCFSFFFFPQKELGYTISLKRTRISTEFPFEDKGCENIQEMYFCLLNFCT